MECPVCRAANETGPACRRCKADLSMLFGLEQQRRVRLNEAMGALKKFELDRANVLLAEAEGIRRDEESAQIHAVSALLRGDFAAARALSRLVT